MTDVYDPDDDLVAEAKRLADIEPQPDAGAQALPSAVSDGDVGEAEPSDADPTDVETHTEDI